jgi:hypothetical protein
MPCNFDVPIRQEKEECKVEIHYVRERTRERKKERKRERG